MTPPLIDRFARLPGEQNSNEVTRLTCRISWLRCGNNYGWSRFEGTRCQEAVQGNKLNPMCEHIDRSEFEFPYFEYCHPDYHSDKASEREFTGNNDFCGDRLITGHAVIGTCSSMYGCARRKFVSKPSYNTVVP